MEIIIQYANIIPCGANISDIELYTDFDAKL